MLEKSSTSYLGSRDRGFESRSPDHKKTSPFRGGLLHASWQGIRKAGIRYIDYFSMK